MKKMILPAALLLIIVGYCIFSVWHVDQVCTTSVEYLQQAETRCSLGDYDGARELVYQAKYNWDCHEGFLGLALRHTESDDIGILFPPLIESCRQRDFDEFSRRNLEMVANLKHLARMEMPYYFNIM